MRQLLLIALLSLPLWGVCQEKVEDAKPELTESQIRVRSTTRWAAIIPGSGQIINKKYWKFPIVYGTLGTSLYLIIDNTAKMKDFKQAWIYEIDDDENTFSELTDDNGVLYTLSDLENNTYLFRRYRDLSYLALAGFYLLQIVDANVDAHLRFFDSNDDLSFSLLPPYSKFTTNDLWQVGINLKIR